MKSYVRGRLNARDVIHERNSTRCNKRSISDDDEQQNEGNTDQWKMKRCVFCRFLSSMFQGAGEEGRKHGACFRSTPDTCIAGANRVSSPPDSGRTPAKLKQKTNPGGVCFRER